MPETPLMQPDDLCTAAAACRQALSPALDGDWEAPAGDLDWSCRRTLDHVADALALYAAHLAMRARERLPVTRNGDPMLEPPALLTVVEVHAAVLAEVARAAPPGTRAFHPAGMADPAGFIAMGCAEIVIHTHDVATGLAVPFVPAGDLTARVLRRLFPWAPRDADAWDALRWAAGRLALPDHPRLDSDWYWHCAPLDEWDGTVKRRHIPPGWR